MTASAHERYRDELTLLAHDGPVLRALGLQADWRRTYARFFPDAEPFALLTLERAGRMLRIGVFREPLRFDARDVADDPALPGLRAVLAAGAEIVRYHPGRRCTVRLGDRFGKVGAGPEAFAAQRTLWEHRHELGFAVAEPLASEAGTLWLSALPGEPPRLQPALAERMGAALATLARSSLQPPRRQERTTAADELIRRVPALRADVEALRSDVEPGPPLPVHGGPHPPQWLVDGDALGLVDFDKLALGDPEADVAAFMEAAAEDGGDAIAAAFKAGYGPLDEQRLDAYRKQRRIAKALRAASALLPDGDEKAARRLR